MKRKTFYVALFATLGLMATSCQKEKVDNLTDQPVDEVGVYTVEYSIGGEQFRAVFRSEEEYNALLFRLMALAREGYEVTVSNGNNLRQGNATKDVVVYTTHDQDDAVKWTNQMVLNGYAVQITYDDKTDTYTCVAIK